MSDGRGHRLAVFAIFAALAAGAWASLVADPPLLRLGISAALTVATAVALSKLPLEGLGRLRGAVAVAGVAIAGLAASLVALGLPAADLPPWRWDELADVVDGGLEGLSGSFDYPFAGEDETSRWLLLAAMPPTLIAAAVLAFGRVRTRDRPDAPALVLLIAGFAIPATIRPAAAPILWGIVLLSLVALWLWRRPKRWAAALITVACFAAISVPIASALEDDDPVFDYRDWTLPEPEAGTTFGWDQNLGPITWTRTNDVLFRVRTEDPRYLRAAILDDFYGYQWRRSPEGGRAVPEDTDTVEGTLGVRGDDRWVNKARISVAGLDSPLVLSPGTELDLAGVEDVSRADDGTLTAEEDPLTEGSDYSITAYAPDPSPRLMRKRSLSYPSDLRSYTEIAFPYSAPDPDTGIVAVHRVPMPLWDEGIRSSAIGDEETAGSPYVRIAALTERLTADSKSAYDVVRTIEDYVRNRADYSENPSVHDVPLNAFLFGERSGYCQHFAGAMALMLRFAGIPTRVAAGFTPGERQGPEGEGESTYAVTSFDAHSWVEVYFNGVGWVPFDPTPAAAPNRSQSEGETAPSSANPSARGGQDDRELARAREPDFAGQGAGPQQAFGEERSSGGGPGPALLLIVALPLVGLGLFTLIRARRHRGLDDEEAADRELRELAEALGPAGMKEPGLTTLRRLQTHFEHLSLPAAAAYAGRLADLRFAPSPGTPPTLAERRAARKDLSSGGGPSRYLRMLLAMPPGGPRA